MQNNKTLDYNSTAHRAMFDAFEVFKHNISFIYGIVYYIFI